MLQPPRVLPSNAPPLPQDDNGNVYEASRIVQEHSGNRQHGDIVFSNDTNVKYASPSLDENGFNIGPTVFAYPQSQPFPFVPTFRLPTYPEGPRVGYSRTGYRYPAPEDEARICADAEKLYSRLCKTEGYIKYRSKQGKDSKGNDQKWPTNLEKAFCRALVQYPPMGRRKQSHKKKLQGRNELIADCILELTGQWRDRKKISSHIQVLKPWVQHDPFIMKWFSKDDMGVKDARSYHSGRRMSHYPVHHSPLDVRTTVPSLARSEFLKIRKFKRDLNVFHPVDFQMFVQRNFQTDTGEDGVERLHTYTNSISNPLGEDIIFNHPNDVYQQYPLLAGIHNRRRLDCTVLDAEASLVFPAETWKNQDGIELGIYFLCVSAHLPATPIAPTARDRGYQVVVHNAFYENGVCAKEHSGSGEARIEDSDRGPGYVETRIKFGSTFWARTLGRLATRLMDKSQDHSEEVAAYLAGIKAVQEILAVSDYGAERLLVIHWKFRHSSTVRGRTSWRRVILPDDAQGGPFRQQAELLQRRKNHALLELQRQQAPPPPQLHTSLAASFQELSTHADNDNSDESQNQFTHAPPATLQSPFEYDTSTSSGSALSSATWSGSFDENTTIHPPLATDGLPTATHEHNTNTNNFDFTAGNMHLTYHANSHSNEIIDPDAAISFDHMQFDSSAFNFDVAAAAGVQPDMHDYTSQHNWYTSYPDFFDGGEAGAQQAVTGGTESFSTEVGEEEGMFNPYSGGESQYDPHHQQEQHDFGYDAAVEQDDHRGSQAYPGAGSGSSASPLMGHEIDQDVIMEGVAEGGGDALAALAALADASYLASALQNSHVAEGDNEGDDVV